jgi:hypothetical protein
MGAPAQIMGIKGGATDRCAGVMRQAYTAKRLVLRFLFR